MSFVQNMLCKLDWWWQLWQICNVTLRERESLYMYVWKMCLCANIFVYVNSAFFIELEHYYETPSSKILFLFFEYPYSAIKWQLWQICIELRKFLQRRPLEYNDTYDVEGSSHSNLQWIIYLFVCELFIGSVNHEKVSCAWSVLLESINSAYLSI